MPASILANEHVLAVPDLARSVAFYTQRLGFEVAWSDAPKDFSNGWCAVARDDCVVRLGHCPDAAPPAELGDHGYFAYWLVDDASALHDAWSAAGVPMLFPPRDEPWGRREFAIRTADGHRIMIGQAIDPPAA
ncbi:VOC family protein [Botrimarina sp.]|uniref:VOC family protein n=1 Tax=Botrimarina sp. TaxID=2795802 RepID=UPI0032EF63F9